MSAGRPPGMEAGGDDGRIIAKKGVARPQVFRQIAKMPVFDPSLGPMHHEQPRFIAPDGRALGNKGFRQRIIKNVSLQRR